LAVVQWGTASGKGVEKLHRDYYAKDLRDGDLEGSLGRPNPLRGNVLETRAGKKVNPSSKTGGTDGGLESEKNKRHKTTGDELDVF